MASIQTNLGANSALLNVGMSGTNLNKEITRLSSGFRINSAGDDAAGLAIANKLRGEGASLTQAGRNASQATSMLQIADGATNTISTIMDRLKELATEANSASIGDQSDKVNAEFQSLISEIGRIASTTQYQGTNLVDGTFGASVANAAGGSTVLSVTGVTGATATGAAPGTYTLTSGSAGHLTMTSGGVSQTLTDVAGPQSLDFSALGITLQTGTGYVADSGVGAVVVAGNSASFMVSSSGNYGTTDLITLNAINLSTGATGLNLQGLDLSNAADAQTALTRIDAANDKVNTAIGTVGAAESRLNFASTNVATITQNVTAAESTIRDADMAAETTQFTKYNILQQAGMAMISQANQSASEVLTLLR